MIEDNPLDSKIAARYIAQVAGALAEAHSHGILRRDLKPHNVMVERRMDRAMLADFGLAKPSGRLQFLFGQDQRIQTGFI